MSQELDNILHSMSTAVSTCHDLNGDGRLDPEEQTVFYQFAEHIILLLAKMHADYDDLSREMTDSEAEALLNSWAACNSALDDFKRSPTSPKMRVAVAKTAYAIDFTSSTVHNILARARANPSGAGSS